MLPFKLARNEKATANTVAFIFNLNLANSFHNNRVFFFGSIQCTDNIVYSPC